MLLNNPLYTIICIHYLRYGYEKLIETLFKLSLNISMAYLKCWVFGKLIINLYYNIYFVSHLYVKT